MTKTAVVLGGTNDHIVLIHKLKKRGYQTVLVDYLDNPPAKYEADEYIQESILDKEKVLEIAKQRGAELVISTCIDQALLTMAYVSEKLALPCHVSYQTALDATHKVSMKRLFREHDIPSVQHIAVETEDDLEGINLSLPLVVKPADANSSKGISKISEHHALHAAVKDALGYSRTNSVVVEEFFEGEEFSIDVIVKNGVSTVLMVTKNIKNKQNPKNFTIVQNQYPGTTDPTVLRGIDDIVQKIVDAYGIKNGPMLVQMLHNQGELSVIELGARIGGGSKYAIIQAVTGFDMIEYFIRTILGEADSQQPRQVAPYAYLTYVFTRSGVISAFQGFDEIKQKGLVDEVFFYKTVGMEIVEAVASTDSPACLLTYDTDLDNMNRRVKQAEEIVAVIDQHGKDMALKDLY